MERAGIETNHFATESAKKAGAARESSPEGENLNGFGAHSFRGLCCSVVSGGNGVKVM